MEDRTALKEIIESVGFTWSFATSQKKFLNGSSVTKINYVLLLNERAIITRRIALCFIRHNSPQNVIRSFLRRMCDLYTGCFKINLASCPLSWKQVIKEPHTRHKWAMNWIVIVLQKKKQKKKPENPHLEKICEKKTVGGCQQFWSIHTSYLKGTQWCHSLLKKG